MLETVKKFHLKVERFFEARKREASLKRAVALFVFVVLFLGFLFTFSKFGLSVELFSVGLQTSFSSVSSVFFNLSLLVAAILFAACLVLFAACKFVGGKANFWQVLYVLMLVTGSWYFIVFLIGFINTLLDVPLAAQLLIILSHAVFFYFGVAGLKTVNDFAYGQTIATIIFANAILFALTPVLLYGYIVYAGLNPPPSVPHTFESSVLSDGSLNVTYNKSNGKCSFIFPENWRVADEAETRKFLVECNYRTDYLQYKLFYGANKSQMLFFYLFTPPWTCDSDYIEGVCESWEDRRVPCRLNESEFEFENYELKKIRDDKIEVCDAKFANSKTGEVVHNVALRFYNRLCFEFEYASKTGNDSNLSYILERVECIPPS